MENDNVNQQENQQQEENQQQQQEQTPKTFTQAEVDQMISQRLARERKGQPSAEELAAFREYQKAHAPKDDATKLKDALSELASLKAEREIERRERFVERLGVSDDVEAAVYVNKILAGMEDPTDFDAFKTAAKEFLKEHKPRSASGGGTRVDFGGRLSGGNTKKNENQVMNDLIRGRRK